MTVSAGNLVRGKIKKEERLKSERESSIDRRKIGSALKAILASIAEFLCRLYPTYINRILS